MASESQAAANLLPTRSLRHSRHAQCVQAHYAILLTAVQFLATERESA